MKPTEPTEPTQSRRGLLKKTLGGAVLLAAAGAVPLALRGSALRPLPARGLRFFTPAEYAIAAAFAERVLSEVVSDAAAAPPGGALDLPESVALAIASQPQAPAPAEVDVAGKMDAFLAPLPPAQAKELKQLLALFDNGLFSLVGGGPATNFTRMTPAQQDAHLADWAYSRLAVKRTGYQALKRLSAAIYFGSPEVFASLGYPGPPVDLVRTVNLARAAEAAAASSAKAAAAQGSGR